MEIYLNEQNEQDEYYSRLPGYINLKELGIMINSAEYKSDDIIEYIKLHKIGINSYIKISMQTYAPLIYSVSIAKKNAKLFKWLEKNGARVDLQLDCSNISDGTPSDPDIEYICRKEYLSYPCLKNKCSNSIINIEYILCRGDIKRIHILGNIDVILKHVKNNPSIIFNILNTLIQKITVLCGTPKYNHSSKIDKCINKYAELYKLLASVIQVDYIYEHKTFMQLCCDWYLYPIIKVIPRSREMHSPIFYEDLNKEVVAIYRQIYNEFFYYNTCVSLNAKVDYRLV